MCLFFVIGFPSTRRGMAGKRHIVELMYDTLSPWSYLTFEVLTRCNKHWQSMDLKLQPVLLGAIFKAHGTLHQSIPARRSYSYADIRRCFEYHDVPCRSMPDNFQELRVKGSMKSQRILTAVNMTQPDKLEKISRQFFRRVWVEHDDINNDISIMDICMQAGFTASESKKLLDEISQNEVKKELKNVTTRAIEDGVFGTPTYFLHRNNGKTMFFGSDRLFLLAHYLGESWPPPKS